MTTPSAVTPSKAKTWTALVGSLLAFALPMVVSVQNLLPEPWPAVIGAVLAVATATGVYHANYAPAGTTATIVPDTTAPPSGGWRNPWRS